MDEGLTESEEIGSEKRLEYAGPVPRRRWEVRRALGAWRFVVYPLFGLVALYMAFPPGRHGVWVGERILVSENQRFALNWVVRGDDGTWTAEERRDATCYSVRQTGPFVFVREDWGGTVSRYVAVPTWVAMTPLAALVVGDVWLLRRARNAAGQARGRYREGQE